MRAHIEWHSGLLRLYPPGTPDEGFDQRAPFVGSGAVQIHLCSDVATIGGLSASQLDRETRLEILYCLRERGAKTLQIERHGREVVWDVATEIEKMEKLRSIR